MEMAEHGSALCSLCSDPEAWEALAEAELAALASERELHARREAGLPLAAPDPKATEAYQGHANRATWAACNAIRQDAANVQEVRALMAGGLDRRAALAAFLEAHPGTVADFAAWATGTVNLDCLAGSLREVLGA